MDAYLQSNLSKQDKIIFLVDMNAFFASVEQNVNPNLRGKPIAVGGPYGTRSVVAAASYESRKFGIKSGMPIYEAVERCPDITIVSGDMDKYIHTSREIVLILKDYTDELEIYSIDECFMDVTKTIKFFGGTLELAKTIKRRIFNEVGIKCSVGIGPNKIIAKLAAGMQKPDGLTWIKPHQVSETLENLPVEELHGIGSRLGRQLAYMGIKTAGHLGRASSTMLKRRFGKMGDILHKMGNGTYDPPIIAFHQQPDIKSVGHSHTMSKDTWDMEIINRLLLWLSEMVGKRMRDKQVAGRTISLVIRYADFYTLGRQKKITRYIDEGYDIYEAAMTIFNKHYDSSKAVRLLGVSVSDLVKGVRQLELFDDGKQKNLTSAIDKINEKYGEWSVCRASLLGNNNKHVSYGFGVNRVI